MIVTPGPLRTGSAGDRLLRSLGRRGHVVGEQPSAPAGALTLFVCPAPEDQAPDLAGWLARHATRETRLLVLTRLGTHPDAASPRLRECWALEEAARVTGRPALVLRLGPLLGPVSPLWLRLRARSGPLRGGAKLLNPVAETDVVETLDRALSGRAEWSGWCEVAGPEVWSLDDLAALAQEAGTPLPAGSGAWEPPLEELQEHRLAEAEPWLGAFGLSVRPLAEQAREWAAAPAGSGR